MSSGFSAVSSSRQLPGYICRPCLCKILRSRPKHSSVQARHITQKHIGKIQIAEKDWAERAKLIDSGQKQSMLSLLEERGYVNQIIGGRAKLDQLMTQKRVGFYAGVDPTAPSIHVGHMLPFMVLGWLYVHGYPVTFLLGGATARVGDPTDRFTARPEQHSSTRKANMANMHMQLKRLGENLERYGEAHGYRKEWAWKRALINNNAWWHKTTFTDFLKTTGQNFRLGPMLGRDTVKNRLATQEGMSFAEFTYPLMQAYDWWRLFQLGVQVQIGGADQFGNILAGAESVKSVSRQNPPNGDESTRPIGSGPTGEGLSNSDIAIPYGFTVPLLTTSSGEKVGKSAGNAIWLDQDMTSLFDLYQYFLRSSDSDVERYLKLFTFLPLAKIRRIMAEHIQDPSKRVAQHALAREFVTIVHGAQAAAEAEGQHRMIFKPRATTNSNIEVVGDWNVSLNKYAPQTNVENMGSLNVTLPQSLVVGQPLHKVLWYAGLVSSKGEGHRLVASRGAHIGGKAGKESTLSDELSWRPIATTLPEETEKYIIDGDMLMLRVGKWKVRIVKIVSDEEYEASGLTCPGWKEGPEAGVEDWKELQKARSQSIQQRKKEQNRNGGSRQAIAGTP